MKIGLFVDIPNLFYCAGKKFEGRRIDYQKLMNLMTEYGEVLRAVAYGGQRTTEAESFIRALKHLGFETRFKEPKEIKIADKIVSFVQWEVGFCCDVVRTMGRVDVVILASANPNLAELVQYVRGSGMQCVVIGVGIPRELRSVASRVVELDESILAENQHEEISAIAD